MWNSKGRLTAWAAALLLVGASAAGAEDLRLIQAVKDGNLQAAQALIKQKADVNARQPDGATALHWAVNAEDAKMTALLLAAGARVDAANDYGVTPLTVAAAGRTSEILEALLAAGANPNTALPTGETVLMTASRSGSLGAVRALLARGADPNASEHVMGQTAMMWAIVENHGDVVQALIAKGADIRARTKGDFTTLMFAIREGRSDVVRVLLDRGADVNDTDKEGNSALHVAVLRGYLDIAKALLVRGADPNAAKCGFTALHWASGIFESIHSHDYIFNQTANVRVHEWAVLAGILDQQAKHDMIAALLAHGADINARTNKRVPEFGFALFQDSLTIGATPLYFASLVSDVPTMRLLLANGADPLIPNQDGNTPLIMAAGFARVPNETRVPEERILEAVKLLLDVGSNVNDQNKNGFAPLHAATMWELHDVLRYLLTRGANINIKNKNGDTPYKIALNGFEHNVIFHLRLATAKILKELGASEE